MSGSTQTTPLATKTRAGLMSPGDKATLGTALQTANALSEIAAAGTGAQASARTSIGAASAASVTSNAATLAYLLCISM